MHIATTTNPDDLAAVHEDVLRPSFPDDELADLASLRAMLTDGSLRLVVARDDERVRGAAVGQRFRDSGVLLLAYLALAPGQRGGGVGSLLLDRAIDAWRTELDPWLVVAEVEDPAAHAASTAHGDPEARLRFYRRHGARTLPVPYLQPAIRPGGSRVPGLLLLALHASGDRLAGIEPDGTWLVPTPPLRAFLSEYFTLSEGAPPSDPEWDAIVAALAPPVLRVP